MAAPTAAEVRAWADMAGDTASARVDEATAAAVAWIENATGLAGAEFDEVVRLAALMLASRWAKRGETPVGIAGFDDLGAVRITRSDPDIDELLAPYLPHTGFA